MADLVETYSGHRVHERPLRFQVEGSWKTVIKIISRRREPGTLGFTVLADDGRSYYLHYTHQTDIWKVAILPLSGGPPPRF